MESFMKMILNFVLKNIQSFNNTGIKINFEMVLFNAYGVDE